MKKEIEKQWSHLKVYLHSLPENKGLEISHLNGRDGCFKVCLLLIIIQTKKQHEQEHKDHKLRTANMDLIREISLNWDRHYGCMKVQGLRCLRCPLLNKETREAVMAERVVNEFFSHF